MKTDFDDRTLDYRKLPNGEYIVILGLNKRVDIVIEDNNKMPSQLVAFLLRYSK